MKRIIAYWWPLVVLLAASEYVWHIGQYGGYLIGLAAASLAYFNYDYWRKRGERRRAGPLPAAEPPKPPRTAALPRQGAAYMGRVDPTGAHGMAEPEHRWPSNWQDHMRGEAPRYDGRPQGLGSIDQQEGNV